ncbi:MAG: mannonate dehydratase [Chloroflexota bacterium]
MRFVGGPLRDDDPETLAFLKQLGFDEVLLSLYRATTPGTDRLEESHIYRLCDSCRRAGLSVAALEHVPFKFYGKAMLGLPGRDEQIENYCGVVRAASRAGVPVLGIHWMPSGVCRTAPAAPIRGGALAPAFAQDELDGATLTFDRQYSPEEMWADFAYFMRAVLPVAEEVGVKLALHPNDPPVPVIGGVPQLFHNFAAFRRALDEFPSDALGLDFCQGTWAEMPDVDLFQAIRHFVTRRKVLYVHFRNVRGRVPRFTETFVDEGDVDMLAALKVYKECGFDGFFIDDHVPAMAGDSAWGHRAHAYAAGYIRALLDVVER